MGCNNFIGIRASTAEAKLNCLNAIRHWCNCAKSFERQRHHVGRSPDILPDVSVIHAQRIDEAPPAVVRTDEELDAIPAQGDRPVPLVRPKVKAKAKLKGRPVAKASAKRRPQASSSSSSSSSSSGSGDSSITSDSESSDS